MTLPRLHLFEFNDSPWAPAPLRDTLIEALGSALERGRVLQGAVEPFVRFLGDCGATEVLDLCAGTGQPASLFVRELERQGKAVPRFHLTDLFPRVEAWEALERARPHVFSFAPGPVDATRVPPELARGRACVIVNALHHFRPEVARRILLSAAEHAPGVFVAESLTRNPLRFAAMGAAGVAGLLEVPLRAKQGRLARAAIAWLSPVGLLASAWDGSVSSLRTHSARELEEMVRPLGDAWEWTAGVTEYGGFGRGNWFAGVRRR